ncbi:unnamed protein product [Rotaria sp. Silwood2]|nr:unnamed protein product [Rotaria sp. Silwood2]
MNLYFVLNKKYFLSYSIRIQINSLDSISFIYTILIKASFLYVADEINHLTSSEFQRHLLTDRATKLELILADEERIREITKTLSEIDTLARVLDGEYFEKIPKLSTTLNKLLVTHNDLKDHHSEFTQELSNFLQNYAAFTLMMDENLQQYKQILNKNQKTLSEIQDNPIE